MFRNRKETSKYEADGDFELSNVEAKIFLLVEAGEEQALYQIPVHIDEAAGELLANVSKLYMILKMRSKKRPISSQKDTLKSKKPKLMVKTSDVAKIETVNTLKSPKSNKSASKVQEKKAKVQEVEKPDRKIENPKKAKSKSSGSERRKSIDKVEKGKSDEIETKSISEKQEEKTKKPKKSKTKSSKSKSKAIEGDSMTNTEELPTSITIERPKGKDPLKKKKLNSKLDAVAKPKAAVEKDEKDESLSSENTKETEKEKDELEVEKKKAVRKPKAKSKPAKDVPVEKQTKKQIAEYLFGNFSDETLRSLNIMTKLGSSFYERQKKSELVELLNKCRERQMSLDDNDSDGTSDHQAAEKEDDGSESDASTPSRSSVISVQKKNDSVSSNEISNINSKTPVDSDTEDTSSGSDSDTSVGSDPENLLSSTVKKNKPLEAGKGNEFATPLIKVTQQRRNSQTQESDDSDTSDSEDEKEEKTEVVEKTNKHKEKENEKTIANEKKKKKKKSILMQKSAKKKKSKKKEKTKTRKSIQFTPVKEPTLD